MQVHSKMYSFCPSRFGDLEAPDLDVKPDLRSRKPYYRQERCPEIGDTRLLAPQRYITDDSPFDRLTLTSEELLEAREIYCKRKTLKVSYLSHAQYKRLVKRLGYLWVQYEKNIMQYILESDVEDEEDNDFENQMIYHTPNKSNGFSLSYDKFRAMENYFSEHNFCVSSMHTENETIVFMIGDLGGVKVQIQYEIVKEWISFHDFDQWMDMENQGLTTYVRSKLSWFVLGSETTLQDVIDKAEKVDVDRMNNAMTAHEEAMTAISDAISAAKDLIPAFARTIMDHLIFIVAAAIIYCKYYDQPFLMAMVTLMVVAHCGITSAVASCIAKLVAHLIKLAGKPKEIENQGDEFEDWTAGFISLATMIATACGVVATGKSDSAVKKFETFMRTSNTGFNFAGNLTKLFKLCFCQIYFWIYGVDYLGQEEQVILDKMSKFMLAAKGLTEDEVVKKMSQDLSLYFTISDLYKEGTMILKEIQESALPKRSIVPFTTVYNAVQTLWKEASAIHAANKKEFQPTWVYLVGDTSVGKSNFQMMLVTYIREKHEMKYTDEAIYERQKINNQSFWDAYRQNQVCTIDDLFQLDNKEIVADQAVELIKMCNEFQMPLNRASIMDKGNSYFTSELIITSTNRMKLGTASEMGIASLQAFCRRRDFVVYLTLDPDILVKGSAINQIDKKAFDEKYGSFKSTTGESIHIHPGAWRIYLRDKMADASPNGIVPGKTDKYIDFFQFANMVDEKIQSYKDPTRNVPAFLKKGKIFFDSDKEPDIMQDPAIVSAQKIALEPMENMVTATTEKTEKYLQDALLQGEDEVPLLDKRFVAPEVALEQSTIPEMQARDLMGSVVDVNLDPYVNVVFFAYKVKKEVSPYEHCGIFYIIGEGEERQFFLCDVDEKGRQHHELTRKGVDELFESAGMFTQMAQWKTTYSALARFHRHKWTYHGINHNCKIYVMWIWDQLEWLGADMRPIRGLIIDNMSERTNFEKFKDKFFKNRRANIIMENENYMFNSAYAAEIKKRIPTTVDRYTEKGGKYFRELAYQAYMKIEESRPEIISRIVNSYDVVQRSLVLPFKEFCDSFKMVKDGDYKPKSTAALMGATLAKIDRDYPLIKWLLIGTAAVSVLAFILLLIKKKFKTSLQGNVSGDKTTQKNAKRKVKNLVADLKNQGAVTSSDGMMITSMAEFDAMYEEGGDKQAVEILYHRVIPNMARVVVFGKDNFQCQQNILFVKGRQAITTSHLFPDFVKNDDQALIWVGFQNGFHILEDLRRCKLKFWKEADLCTILFPEDRFPMFTDITKHFMPEEKLTGFTKGMFVTQLKADIVYDESVVMKRKPIFVVQKAIGINPVDTYVVPSKYGEYETRNGFSVSGLVSEKGDCGGVYMVLDKNRVRKLFGLHTALSASRGAHGVYVSKDRLESNLFTGFRECAAREDEIVTNPFMEIQGAFPEKPIGLFPLGNVKHGTVFNSVSNIVPSIIQGEFTKPDTAPAVLRQQGDLKPVENGLNKWNLPVVMVDNNVERVVKNVCEDLVHQWGQPSNDVPDVCTQHEALHGMGCVKHLELSTSAGFTANMKPHKLPGKRSFISVLTEEQKKDIGLVGIEDFYQCTPTMRQTVIERLQKAKNGVVARTIWQDSLKDERLELEKVAEGRTRLFMTGDVDNTIACRQYFMRFTDHIMKNRMRLSCKVGINPDGQEWGQLWKWFHEVHQPKFIAGDFKSFDMSIPKWLVSHVVDAILEWFRMIQPYGGYGLYINAQGRKIYVDELVGGNLEEQNNIRWILMEEISQATRINGRVVYRCLQGVPSGHFLTAIFNSIINEVIIKTCIMYYCEVKEIEMNFVILRNNFRIATYGDDHIVAVSSKYHFFDQQLLQKLIKIMFGMNYTDSLKRLEVEQWTKAEDLTFLQRYFRVEGAQVFAPLKKDIIDEMINWVRISEDYTIKESTFLNLGTALKEWFQWGEKIFEEKRRLFRSVCFRHSAEPFSTTYAGLYKEWLLK